jgi:hypothetical protein
LDKLYPDSSSNNSDGVKYWKGMKIIPLDKWLKIIKANTISRKGELQRKGRTEKMQRTRQGLVNDITGLERKISILDKIAFSSELECKRKEQQVQELIAQKDRIEKLIANILNEEGYSTLKQIVKENVKAAVSENKKLIPIAFAALIQTLKDDPELVNLIYSISSGNNGEQHKDNNNGINKYLESNKDILLDLGEKNYKTLQKY